MHAQKLIVQFLAICLFAFVGMAQAKDVLLSADDVRFLKRVMAQDKVLKELPTAHSGLQALNGILKLAPAPVSIALSWNQMAISAWRVANSSLLKWGKQSICEEIDFMI